MKKKKRRRREKRIIIDLPRSHISNERWGNEKKKMKGEKKKERKKEREKNYLLKLSITFIKNKTNKNLS
jgi:hypothetical protein